MHDLDRTQLELVDDFEIGDDEFEVDDDLNDEFVDDYELDLDEDEELELAMELLSVSDDEELEQFLGSLIKRAAKAARGVARTARKVWRSPITRGIIRIVRPIAKQYLPHLGRAAGTALGAYAGGVGAPIGGTLGSGLGSAIASRLEIDITGLAPDEIELEVAKKIVRLTTDAAKKAFKAPASAEPSKVVKAAIQSAAKKHAPGLLKTGASHHSPLGGGGRSGRWIRRGRKLIVLGA